MFFRRSRVFIISIIFINPVNYLFGIVISFCMILFPYSFLYTSLIIIKNIIFFLTIKKRGKKKQKKKQKAGSKFMEQTSEHKVKEWD